MLPAIVALIVGISLGAYVIEALSAVGDFEDPHDWEWEEDEDGD